MNSFIEIIELHPIYEGTNSVQAADLVFRKLNNKNGNIIERYLNNIKAECNIQNEKIRPFIKELNYHLDILSKFNDWNEVKKLKTIKMM